MARAISRVLAFRYAVAVLAGGLLGGILGIASAQETRPGSLDTNCAAKCVADGNRSEFCGEVCWVLDPAIAARSEPVNWPCYSSCRERGGRPAECMPVCRRR
jgi:hypothetical protein